MRVKDSAFGIRLQILFVKLHNSPNAAIFHGDVWRGVVVVATVRVVQIKITNFLPKQAPCVSHSASEWHHRIASKAEGVFSRSAL
jgi:hypothetical protein